MRTLVCRGAQAAKARVDDGHTHAKKKRQTTISGMNGGDASRHTTQEEKTFCRTIKTKTQRHTRMHPQS